MWTVKRDGKTIFTGSYKECTAFIDASEFPKWQLHLKLKSFVTV